VKKQAKLILDDGSIFKGKVFASGPDVFGEVIFNTGMSGYEEVLTDPSYKEQMVVMTYPLIGNYGINKQDHQSKNIHLKALIVKEYIDFPSNFTCKTTLKKYLEENNVIGIEGIDTRALTRNLRVTGAKKGYISTEDISDEELIKKVKESEDIEGKNLAKLVSTKTKYEWDAPEETKFKVAVIDCGVKFGILDQLKKAGCEVTVFPYNVGVSEIKDKGFDGALISNGPGDPVPVTEAQELIRTLAGEIPIFGICLGHQILSIAFGFKIVKLPFGHHGLNHPVKNLITGAIEITSQNHIYCSEAKSISDEFEVTHVNQNDHTIAGIRSKSLMAFSVQHHPEAAPGPNDSNYLFKEFTYLMKHKCFSDQKVAMKNA
jgi:carbamoyl-phosphate synthase small subunit